MHSYVNSVLIFYSLHTCVASSDTQFYYIPGLDAVLLHTWIGCSFTTYLDWMQFYYIPGSDTEDNSIHSMYSILTYSATSTIFRCEVIKYSIVSL